ncbi:cation diffusion facilitator family transporter [Acutalibacter caecimuris]|uniref:cation diffusion facilitator family transporter n=1 Tax=Acutalibacter caecimuris TaxID=3093657 RepID=UPI002AC9BBD3|nr:cation diffusion facilitator family transporter [Acutalibacter sp. M00118]
MYEPLMKLLVKGYGGDPTPQVREKSGRAAGAVGIATNLLLFAIKLIAGLLSHSVAILADAVNNLTDSGSSIIMLVGFKLAGKPADKEHPFGHARIEYLCGVIVSFIVLFLGLELAKSSVEKIITPKAAAFGPLSLAILVISVLLKLWQCGFYLSVGRKIGSGALTATASDSRNDVIATAVVLLGAVITRLTSLRLDGWLGLLVAGFIVVSGVRLIMETADPLLGAAPRQELVQAIYQKIRGYQGIIGIHDLTVHSYGEGRCFASVHCEVPAEEDILVSHDLIDNIERDFLEQEGIHLVIHLDPVVTGDPKAQALREQVLAQVKAAYPQAAIHDFRVVWGVTHSNVLFDVAVPFSLQDSDSQVRQTVARAVQSLDPTYRPVLTVDREGVVNELET